MTENTGAPKTPPPIKVQSLSDLGTRLVTVRVETAYGRALDITLKTPSIHEWHEAGAGVNDPIVPRTAVEAGKPAANINDVGYRAALYTANMERHYRRLVVALEGGGVPFPDGTLAEKSATLKAQLDAGVAHALIEFLAGAIKKAESVLFDDSADSTF